MNKQFLFIMMVATFTSFSCKKFIEVDAPKSSLVPTTVFRSNDLATSAVMGIYQQMSTNGYASGNESSIATFCGVSADEFIGYSNTLKSIFENQVTPETGISIVWTNAYQRIYDANAILQGLESSNSITPSIKSQLQGEALFIRAFNYFYLVNLFGPVPLNLTTDYKLNSQAPRTSVSEIYEQILKDLNASKLLLNDGYISNQRTRPNKDTAYALLSRTYLYIGDWENADKYATLIIDKTNTYKLTPLNDVFLSNSLEAIWQLMPPPNTNTLAGNLLVLTTTPSFVSLMPNFVTQVFEQNDQRKAAWVRSIQIGTATFYYPFKYKVKSSATVSEYYMVFRLAEQLLIRAEAKAQKNNLTAAINDVDAIRSRAGLSLIKNSNPSIDKESLITVIQKERFAELFTEWGDRWLDLKRNGKSAAMLAQVKPNWKPEHVLFPIPKAEIDRNLNVSQNDGY